jgi:DNA (cytosine-5)-methyltransferase 1
MTMTTVLNIKIGEAREIPRLWMEGDKLSRAGVQIGARYALTSPLADRIELRQVDASYSGDTFNVSQRSRNGNLRPLMEIRSAVLRKVFAFNDKVRVAIRDGRIVITANHLETKMFERMKRLMNKLATGTPLACASAFHGIGILDKALHAGFKRAHISTFVKVAIELESTYLDVSLRNNPELFTNETIAVCSDIRDVDFSRNAPQVEILCAGIPCVGASLSGRAKNSLDFAESHSSAGTLFFDFLEAVKNLNPAFVICENVVPFARSASMAVIRSVLDSLGYNVYETALRGADFGALEDRERLVFIAVCKTLPMTFDWATVKHAAPLYATLGDALDPISNNDPRWKTYDYLATKAKRDKAAGKGFARQLLDRCATSCGTVGRGYWKARSTEPFLKHPTNPELSRLFTPAEHARIKGIPENVIAGESDTIAHEGLGQSVIYPQFQAVGFAIGQEIARMAANQFVFGQAA